ncbi:uncharacterized protein [Montipora foliosa]|uniref:uncharacterized protein n=1 Tax=Montipora foliosa TaxID=591990 RepID=UPI0035F14B6D
MVTYQIGNLELLLTDLTKQMCHLSDVMNHFWRRWRDKYLVELRGSHFRSAKDNAVQTQISVSDVVVVHDKDQPHEMWRLGKVERLIGTDSLVRSAVVKVGSKNRRSSLLKHPIQGFTPWRSAIESSLLASNTGRVQPLISNQDEILREQSRCEKGND